MISSNVQNKDLQQNAVVTIEDLRKSYVLGHMELPVLKGLDLLFFVCQYLLKGCLRVDLQWRTDLTYW